MYGADADARFAQTLLHAALVFVVGEGDGGVGNEHGLAHRTEETIDFGQRIAEILLPALVELEIRSSFLIDWFIVCCFVKCAKCPKNCAQNFGPVCQK